MHVKICWKGLCAASVVSSTLCKRVAFLFVLQGMLWETSLLDAEEGIRFRGFSIPELQVSNSSCLGSKHVHCATYSAIERSSAVMHAGNSPYTRYCFSSLLVLLYNCCSHLLRCGCCCCRLRCQLLLKVVSRCLRDCCGYCSLERCAGPCRTASSLQETLQDAIMACSRGRLTCTAGVTSN